MEEFTKEKEVGSISKVLSLKPPTAFYRKPDESWELPFWVPPNEKWKDTKNTGERGEEEILSLSSQRERRKSNKWFRLYSRKMYKGKYCSRPKNQGNCCFGLSFTCLPCQKSFALDFSVPLTQKSATAHCTTIKALKFLSWICYGLS